VHLVGFITKELEVTFYFSLRNGKEQLQRAEATELRLLEVFVEIRQELNISYLTTLYTWSDRPQATSHKPQEKDNKIPGNRWVILSRIGIDVLLSLLPVNCRLKSDSNMSHCDNFVTACRRR
jgi:hypothetical protein